MKQVIILSHIPVLLLVVFALIWHNRVADAIKRLLFFVYFSLLCQSVALVLWMNGSNNLWLLHFNIPIGFALLGSFYNVIWKSYISSWLIPGVVLAFVVFSWVNSMFFQNLYIFNSNALTIQSVLLVILSLASFSLLMSQPTNENLQMSGALNWINSGMFIYYASNLIFFFFGDVLMNKSFPTSAGRLAWIPHTTFSNIMYLCFFIGVWKSPKSKHSM